MKIDRIDHLVITTADPEKMTPRSITTWVSALFRESIPRGERANWRSRHR